MSSLLTIPTLANIYFYQMNPFWRGMYFTFLTFDLPISHLDVFPQATTDQPSRDLMSLFSLPVLRCRYSAPANVSNVSS